MKEKERLKSLGEEEAAKELLASLDGHTLNKTPNDTGMDAVIEKAPELQLPIEDVIMAKAEEPSPIMKQESVDVSVPEP